MQVAREMGALVRLQFALHSLAGMLPPWAAIWPRPRGDRGGAGIAAATGTSPVAYTEMTLTALRGQEALTAELTAREQREAGARLTGG